MYELSFTFFNLLLLSVFKTRNGPSFPRHLLIETLLSKNNSSFVKPKQFDFRIEKNQTRKLC